MVLTTLILYLYANSGEARSATTPSEESGEQKRYVGHIMLLLV